MPLKGDPLVDAPPPPLVHLPAVEGDVPNVPHIEVPKHDVFQDSILNIISQLLYLTKYEPKSNPQLYLDLEINFKEFELILVKFALVVCAFS